MALASSVDERDRSEAWSRLRSMPRLLLSLAIIVSFFAVGALLCLFAVPRLLLGRPRPRAQRRYRGALNRGFERFMAMLRAFHLIDYRLPPRRADHPEGAYLLIANHPGLLDVALLLAACPEAVCLVKASWYRSLVLGPLLRLGDHIPGPGSIEASSDEADSLTPVLARIERKLRDGVPVVVFPEGTRSPHRGLRRFHRGALEAAVRAKVPVVRAFLDVDPPLLMKGQGPWQLPRARARYEFEWLGHVDTVNGPDSRELARTLRQCYEARLARVTEG